MQRVIFKQDSLNSDYNQILKCRVEIFYLEPDLQSIITLSRVMNLRRGNCYAESFDWRHIVLELLSISYRRMMLHIIDVSVNYLVTMPLPHHSRKVISSSSVEF